MPRAALPPGSPEPDLQSRPSRSGACCSPKPSGSCRPGKPS
ncbi:rCG60034 [Rattus norvegicus]|uniref:RCG60034 n=1 Tax=Rattus norvegicus TaxID=10116 RepID=A6HRN2_RAT|nr:rCG60034 [Rattus norvegicus]